MLTVDYRRLGLRPGERVLDVGCGAGRHTHEAVRLGARAVALDLDGAVLKDVRAMLDGDGEAVHASVLALPFGDAAFDRVIAAEVLEHIPDDARAIDELARVLRPGGTLAVTVPRWFPETVCWSLSRDYHRTPGGHVRIYRAGELVRRLRRPGLRFAGAHHAHALHSPYWWLRCAVGVGVEDHPAVRLYHRFLVWDIMRKPRPVRLLERALNPLLGKSFVLYMRRETARATA